MTTAWLVRHVEMQTAITANTNMIMIISTVHAMTVKIWTVRFVNIDMAITKTG